MAVICWLSIPYSPPQLSGNGREGHSKARLIGVPRAPLIALCLVITCVQRAGTIWGLVVRETAWL